MNTLKYKQPNYRYGLNKKTRYIMKQGAIILLSISLIGGYARSRTNNQSFITGGHLETLACDQCSGQPDIDLSADVQGGETKTTPDQVKEEVEAIQVVVPTPTPTTPPTPTTQRQEIENYIREVFGDDADDAFKLLACENRNLDPLAVNDNTVWGGVGRDWNLFQINDVYHPVKELHLDTDWKANVRYAKRMFDNDGGSFRRWTCNYVFNN